MKNKKTLVLFSIATLILSGSIVAMAKQPASTHVFSNANCAIIPPGHLISPGWLKKHGGVRPAVPSCQILPPGIAKKLGNKPPTNPPDVTAPVISLVDVTNITSSSVHITWSTNEPATSKIWYSSSSPVALSSTTPMVSSLSLLQNHNLALTGLASGTIYYYVIGAADAAGNVSTSTEFSFRTLPATTSDTTPPILSGISATGITTSSAHIMWGTNEVATSKVWYGTSSPIVPSSSTLFISSAALALSHDIALTGLASNTTYFYVVESSDAAGNTSMSGQSSFMTGPQPDTTPPVLSGINANTITTSSARVSWSTDEGATSKVWYSTSIPITLGGSTHVVSSTAITLNHNATLPGLVPNTLYFYIVQSADSSGNLSTSGVFSFMTLSLPDTTPPIISSVVSTSTTPTSTHIVWATNELATSKVWYSTSSPVIPGSGSSASSTTLLLTHNLTLTGLNASTTYFYVVQSADASGNVSTSSQSTFTTPPLPDTTPPIISSLHTTSTIATSTEIVWTTNEAANSVVTYGTSNPVLSGLFNISTVPAPTTDHDILLQGLNASTTYFYFVSSEDAAGNNTTSSQLSFTTTP